MSRDDRSKLSLATSFGPLRAVFELLRALPLPAPLQRFTQRGLARLKERIPELAELLEGKPASKARPVPVSSSLPQLLLLLSSRDYRTRAKAAQALANHREDAALDALIATLRDRSVEVAVAAARALAASGGPTARGALLQVLENREGYFHSLTRAAAVQGLGLLLSRAECAPLERALRDLDAEVSIAAISGLVTCAGRDAVPALLGVIDNADGFFLPITRLAAVRGLERLPAPPASELERLRAREVDPLVSEVLDRLQAGPSISAP